MDFRAFSVSLPANEAGITLDATPEAGSTGLASLALTDPDGNAILIDQHV